MFTLPYGAPVALGAMVLLNFACSREPHSVKSETHPNRVAQNAAASNATTGGESPTADAPPPVSIKKATRWKGKPPLLIDTLRIEFRNTRPESVWLVMRFYEDRPLSASGTFRGRADDRVPFEAVQHSAEPFGGKGKAVVVSYFGEDKFRAIRLPPGGAVRYDQLQFDTSSDVTEFEVWEVSALLVNGNTPLEKWLPYDTLADRDVHSLRAGGVEGVKSLHWDASARGYRKDYPAEKVEFVSARVIKKWDLPFKVSPAQ